MVRRRVVVTGLVQGVFFRDACRRTAVGHGVAGWVRNRADGGVEAVFEGPAERVEQLLAWVRHGPPAARVDRVEVAEEEPAGAVGFAVLPTR
ncbi:acylphosphatase [Streptacidiphilus sp. ASG 303]|uniref:acylphosphatase n=1 Tax=Streptacidiphilus sp. ASG 303 TaxID=2896847 RepID=UPI001E3DA1F6|nr:acylphosphatase [Streptacidiphilus sp. ASG 303]MCD0483998.1 acylphosphatase [Streptacidiphilus sp. ASG 303]